MPIIAKKIMDNFETYCKKNGITGKARDDKLKALQATIEKYMYEPGEAIGIVAAQSISEPATQMTMRSYTLASQSDRLSKVTHGLPRLIEIFDARKTFEKKMMIYLKPEYNTKEKAKEVAGKIKSLKLSEILVSDSIDLINMRIELELEKEGDKDHLKEMLEKHAKDAEISFKGKFVYIAPKKNTVKDLRKIKNKILKIHTKGVKGIDNVVVIKEDEDWVIQTTGSNLKKILRIDEVDVARTMTNDIYQVDDVLGIEAARNVILKEARQTLEEQGLDVDVRHLIDRKSVV